jgi:hypothetical protein
MIIDGHFHLHYFQRTSNSKILRQLRKIEKLKEEYSLATILSIIPVENYRIIDKLEDYDFLYPGVYILIEDYNKRLIEKVKKFNFIKINNWLSEPFLLVENLEKLFQDSISIGKKKFQIHTSDMNEKKLNLIERYIKEYDTKFYIPHGVYAIYKSEIPTSRLEKLEGNLFLGTSPSWGAIAEIPNYALIKAIEKGLENMITFESDFILNYGIEEYKYTIESVKRSIRENEKIFHENVKLFLE